MLIRVDSDGSTEDRLWQELVAAGCPARPADPGVLFVVVAGGR